MLRFTLYGDNPELGDLAIDPGVVYAVIEGHAEDGVPVACLVTDRGQKLYVMDHKREAQARIARGRGGFLEELPA